MFEFINHKIPNQKWESNTGNREYKRILNIGSIDELKHDLKKSKISKNDYKKIDYLQKIKLINKINRRASQLQYRLIEGHGKAVYLLGVEDNGTVDGISLQNIIESIAFLFKMVKIVHAQVDKIRVYLGNIDDNYICTVRISIPNYIPGEFDLM